MIMDITNKNCQLKRREAISENVNMDKCGLALCAHSDENHSFVGSGCSRHMTCDKKKCVSLNNKNGIVSFGRGYAKSLERGSLPLLMEKERIKML